MSYASIGMIACIVHIIINSEALHSVEDTPENIVRISFRRYLLSIILYYLTDIAWGILYEYEYITATYVDTVVFFIAMVLSVLLWTKCVVLYTGDKGRLGKILVASGFVIFAIQVIQLVVNLFNPILFLFDENGEYQALPYRSATLFLQMILFLVTAIFAFSIAIRSEGKKRSTNRTVGFSSIVMAFFIALQMMVPMMPFYSLGCLFGGCLIHAFVYKEKDLEQRQQIQAVNQKAYRDGLTGAKNKLSYLEALADIETSLENGTLKEYGVAVFDVNGLKEVNDKLGHEAGDEYIKSACTLISKQFRHSPVFRIGGDEFVAILKGDDYENREALEKEFEEKVDNNKANGEVTVASGITAYVADIDDSYNDVFQRADELMYVRKQALKAN